MSSGEGTSIGVDNVVTASAASSDSAISLVCDRNGFAPGVNGASSCVDGMMTDSSAGGNEAAIVRSPVGLEGSVSGAGATMVAVAGTCEIGATFGVAAPSGLVSRDAVAERGAMGDSTNLEAVDSICFGGVGNANTASLAANTGHASSAASPST
jgi:hypothetical protein